MGMYFITGCLGITLSYHRQLSHRSFTTPKWLEYVFAYCGVMAVQGDPMEWVSASSSSSSSSSSTCHQSWLAGWMAGWMAV